MNMNLIENIKDDEAVRDITYEDAFIREIL